MPSLLPNRTKRRNKKGGLRVRRGVVAEKGFPSTRAGIYILAAVCSVYLPSILPVRVYSDATSFMLLRRRPELRPPWPLFPAMVGGLHPARGDVHEHPNGCRFSCGVSKGTTSPLEHRIDCPIEYPRNVHHRPPAPGFAIYQGTLLKGWPRAKSRPRSRVKSGLPQPASTAHPADRACIKGRW